MYYIFHMLLAFNYNLLELKINIFSILFSIVMPDTQYILIITSSLINWKEPIGIRNLQDFWSEKKEILPWDPGSNNFWHLVAFFQTAQYPLWLWEVKKKLSLWWVVSQFLWGSWVCGCEFPRSWVIATASLNGTVPKILSWGYEETFDY